MASPITSRAIPPAVPASMELMSLEMKVTTYELAPRDEAIARTTRQPWRRGFNPYDPWHSSDRARMSRCLERDFEHHTHDATRGSQPFISGYHLGRCLWCRNVAFRQGSARSGSGRDSISASSPDS